MKIFRCSSLGFFCLLFEQFIKIQFKLGNQTIEILNEKKVVYNDQAPSYATGARWVALFKNGRQSIEDEPAQAAQLQGLLKTILKPKSKGRVSIHFLLNEEAINILEKLY